jgi:murein DD-endopeptidase MepM/ murein hydrolase activator NlpD
MRGDMIGRYVVLGKRIFPERQFLLRSGDRVRYLSLPGWLQASVVAALLVVVGGVGGLAGAYHNLHKALHRKEAQISEADTRAASLDSLRQNLAETDEQYATMSLQFDDVRQQLDAANAENDKMRGAIEEAEARAVALDKTRLALEDRLHGAEQALTGKSGNVTQLGQQLADSRSELRDAEAARSTLQKKLQQLQADSETSTSRAGQLKLTLSASERKLLDIAAERDRLRSSLDQQGSLIRPAPGKGSSSELERLIASTGVDLDKLLGRFAATPPAQGGPYVAYDPRRVADDSKRTEELLSLVKTLPLAAPLVRYQVESGFGERVDPILHGRLAFHSGVDLSAPYRSPVMATAPGTVTFTGVKDDYGRVVEITHAHGIVTRYAHLHRILVAPGQTVGLHTIIAELGSTGRSTGPHVHYEVLVDGQPVDPAKFLEAGKSVGQINAN